MFHPFYSDDIDVICLWIKLWVTDFLNFIFSIYYSNLGPWKPWFLYPPRTYKNNTHTYVPWWFLNFYLKSRVLLQVIAHVYTFKLLFISMLASGRSLISAYHVAKLSSLLYPWVHHFQYHSFFPLVSNSPNLSGCYIRNCSTILYAAPSPIFHFYHNFGLIRTCLCSELSPPYLDCGYYLITTQNRHKSHLRIIIQ